MSYTIAATLGMDMSDLSDCRYQPTRTSRAIFAVGDKYFAQGKTAPKDKVGTDWVRHTDQFWASKKNTTVWECSAISSA